MWKRHQWEDIITKTFPFLFLSLSTYLYYFQFVISLFNLLTLSISLSLSPIHSLYSSLFSLPSINLYSLLPLFNSFFLYPFLYSSFLLFLPSILSLTLPPSSSPPLASLLMSNVEQLMITGGAN